MDWIGTLLESTGVVGVVADVEVILLFRAVRSPEPAGLSTAIAGKKAGDEIAVCPEWAERVGFVNVDNTEQLLSSNTMAIAQNLYTRK